MAEWGLEEAKARLSELIKKAEAEGPQRITVRGEAAAVVLSATDFARLTKPKPRFLDFMRSSPLVGLDLDIERDRSVARDIEVT